MTALVTGRKKLKTGFYPVPPVLLDAKGKAIQAGDWVVPLNGYNAVRGPYAKVLELTSPQAIQVEWRGLALGEPTWADPAQLVVVPKPPWAV